MRIGVQFTTGVGTRIDAWGYDNAPCLFIGNNVQINDYVHIGALQHVEIGNNVLIASRVFISDHDHGNYNSADGTSNPIIPPNSRPLVSKPVVIGNNVWVGEQVCILSGITIGDGSVIGAGTVVTRDVPPNCIVVGNPSRIVRIFDDSKGTWVRP
jgi:lipopolysaccharide O-acetyltransferase